MDVPVTAALSGIEPLDLEAEELIEAAVVLVKVSLPDGRSALHSTTTPGLSHWEKLGILVDAADGMRGGWDD